MAAPAAADAREAGPALVWFRRDLRTYDAPALLAALGAARAVVPVFIWAVEEEGQFQPGRQTRWWFKHSVRHLAARLEALGSRLVLRRGQDSASALRALVAETGASSVYFNHLYDSISMVRDQQIKDELRALGVAVHSFNADLLYEPWQVLDADGQPFTTFKAYWDRCLAMPCPPPLPLPEPPGPLPRVGPEVASLSLEEVDWFMTREQEASTEALGHRWDPSGAEGVRRLEAFLETGLSAFEHDRAKADRDSTTMLSPWIHAGAVSVRHVYYRVAQKHAEWQAGAPERGASCLDFVQQLGYREYSRYLSFHFPFMTDRSMLAHLRAVPWRLDQRAFKAWRQGLTGYPLVDAGMRQLWSTGWCHNRVRVVAASFMVKNLLLPWQWGLKHLWDCQVDADLECDALGWQYVSGCLSDAHPFSHMIDLDFEARRFDPDGNYVRRWLPVLSQLPAEFIHQPWTAPPEVLEAAGVELGFNYPWPIISPEAAKEGVEFAAAVVERCYADAHGGAVPAGKGSAEGASGGGTGTGFNPSGSGGPAAGSGSGGKGGPSASSGVSTDTGGGGGGGRPSGAMPRKEPYRPPTDPALMPAFLEAAREGAAWQGRLPELHDVERAARRALATGRAYDAMAVDGPLAGDGGAAARAGHPFFVGGAGPRGSVALPAESGSGSASCGGGAGAYARLRRFDAPVSICEGGEPAEGSAAAGDEEEGEQESEGGERAAQRRRVRGAGSAGESAPPPTGEGDGDGDGDDPMSEGSGGYSSDDHGDSQGGVAGAAGGGRFGFARPAASAATAASGFGGRGAKYAPEAGARRRGERDADCCGDSCGGGEEAVPDAGVGVLLPLMAPVAAAQGAQD